MNELLTLIEAYPITSITPSFPLGYEDISTPVGEVNISGEGRLEVPFEKRTASFVSRPLFTRGGNLREVEVKWTIKNPSAAEQEVLKALHKGAKSLIINTFASKTYYIPGNSESYRFEVTDEEGSLHCRLSVQNLPGAVQLL